MKSNNFFVKTKTITKDISNVDGIEQGKFANPKRQVKVVEKFSMHYYKKDEINFPRLNAFSGKLFSNLSDVL
jgi:hypothetical protein